MIILCATGNIHKKAEFVNLLPAHEILIPEDLSLDFQVEETGATFCENALIKASSLYSQTCKPVIADDSGICVDALDGAPGIYSARYGNDVLPPEAGFKERCALLLDRMSTQANRSARFVCALVYYYEKDRFVVFQETVEGRIALSSSGTGGFGYDPVFFLPEYNRTMAELTNEEKNRISHRGKAARRLSSFLENV